MVLLTNIVSVLIGLFLLCLLGLIAVGLLTRTINTKGLLHNRNRDGSLVLSPERIQLMILTTWAASAYLIETFDTRVVNPHAETIHTLPDVSTSTLTLLGASHSVYLARKIYSMIMAKLSKGR